MPIKRVVSYDGFDLTANGMFAGINADDMFGTWRVAVDEQPRPGNHPALGAVAMGARRITVNLTFPSGASAATINTAFQTLMGGLSPDEPHDPENPRYLVAHLADGSDTPVQRAAVIEGPLEALSSGGINGFRVVFVSADPAWRLVTPDEVVLDNVSANRLASFNHTFATDLTGWTVANVTAGVTSTGSRDAAVFDDAAGSLKLAITANVAGIGAEVRWRNDEFIPVTVGASYTIVASNRTTSANLTPRLQFRWYDASQVHLSSTDETDWTPTINTWTRRSQTAVAVASAAFVQVNVRAYCDTAGPTGSVYFDRVGFYEDDPLESDSVSIPNDGQARAWPVLTFDSDVLNPGEHFAAHRHNVTITNGYDQDLTAEFIELDIGNTAAWVTTEYGAQSDGSDVYVLRDGVQVPRQLVGFGEVASTMWVYIDHLAAGTSMTLDIVYGGAGEDAVSTPNSRQRPAYDVSAEVVVAAAAGSTTVLNIAGAPGWYTDQWDNGHALILTGARAGQGSRVSSSASATVTLVTALSGALAAGDRVLLRASHEVNVVSDAIRRVYAVKQIDRDANPYRGLWYLSSGEERPADTRWDVPGGWEPFKFLDNADETNQSDYVRLDVGGGDFDSFALLDADRCGAGVTILANEGAYDGIRHSSVFPITAWFFDGALKNPNGMCHGFFGSRENETRDWSEVRDVTTATDAVTLTPFSEVSYTLPDGTHHLCANVLPRDDAAIGPDWAGIRGSRTAGGASATATMTDGTIAGLYVDDQFNEGRIRIVSGVGAGRVRTITDFVGSTGVFTVSSNWGVDLDDTSRYEVVNKTLVATLRSNNTWMLSLSQSDMTRGAITARDDNYPVELIVRVDGTGGTFPYYRLRITIGQQRALMLRAATHQLVLDCPNKRARVLDAAGALVADVTAYVSAEKVLSAAVVERAEEWLPLSPGGHTLFVQSRGAVTWDVTVATAHGWLG